MGIKSYTLCTNILTVHTHPIVGAQFGVYVYVNMGVPRPIEGGVNNSLLLRTCPP